MKRGSERTSLPSLLRPRGFMTPRSPAFLLVLLLLTLAAIWFWGTR
jgi:hypothetical protein